MISTNYTQQDDKMITDGQVDRDRETGSRQMDRQIDQQIKYVGIHLVAFLQSF